MPTIEVPGHGDVEFPDSMPQDQILAALKKLSPPAAPSAGESFVRGAMHGAPNKLVAGSLADAEQRAAVKSPEYIPGTDQLDIPIDAAKYSSTYALLRGQQHAGAAAAEKENPKAYLAGEMVPAVASLAVPGMQGAGGAAAAGGALGVMGSESETPQGMAAEGALGAGLGGAGAKLMQLLGRGAARVGDALGPRAEAIRDILMNKIADRSASAAEKTAAKAAGSAGAGTAEGFRTMERLGQKSALPAEEIAANEAALATPDAQSLAVDGAQKMREKLPGLLEHIQSLKALAAQTAEEAANARGPEAVAAMEQQMRREALKTLTTRYVLPAAGGAIAGEAFGGHVGGGVGLGLGLGARPMLRAILRNATSPAFTAPIARGAVSMADMLKSLGSVEGGRAATLLEPETESKLLQMIMSLEQRPPALAGQ